MLEQMRQGTQNVFIYIAFGILIVVFTFYFGPGADGCQPSQRALMVTVDGEGIYNTDVTVMLNRTNRNRRNLTEADYAQLERQAGEKMALLFYLSNRAEAQGLSVGDEELAKYILDGSQNPEFQIYSEKGVFSKDIYDRYISNYLEMSVEEYEVFKRRELMANKYLKMLEHTLAVQPSEVEQLSALRNTKVNLEFVKFDAKTLEEALSFSDEEVQKYLADNTDKVQKAYEETKKEYGKPKRVRVRRLMVKKPSKDAKDDEKKVIDDKWSAVKKRVLESKEDFVTVINEVSEDIAYKDKGGDMGWSLLEDMNQDMAKVVDTMKVGDIKEHTSDFAYFLLKLDEVEEAEQKSFDEVKREVARKLMVKDVAAERLEALAGQLMARAKAAPDKSLEDALTALKPKAEEPKKEEPAEGATPEGATPEDKPAEGQPAEGDAAAQADKPAKKTAWDLVSVASTGPFARTPRQSYKFDQATKQIVPTSLAWSDVPRIGDDKDLAMKAFALSAEKPLLDKVYKLEDAFYVIRLKERNEPKPEDKDKNNAAVETELRGQRVAAYLGQWRSLFFNTSSDLKETSPWLAQLYQDAQTSGAIKVEPLPAVAPDLADQAPVTQGEGKAGDKAPEKAPAGDKGAEKAPAGDKGK